MPSVRPPLLAHARPRVTGRLAGVASLLVAAGQLAGCATTQQEAARLRLNDDRILASQSDTRVTPSSPRIAVTRLTLVAAGRRAAFIVTVRNSAEHAVSDLPISVGYRVGRRRRMVYLNAGADGDYFGAHLPAIAAHRTLTWVYTARRPPAGARPFALVGAKASVPVGAIGALPAIRAATVGAVRGDQLDVAVRNLSGIPQYQLPVYALLELGGRTVGAGTATVGELAAGSRTTLRLRLLGRVTGGSAALEAPPTIFH